LNHIAARLILVGFGATVMIMAVRRLRAYRLKERHVLWFVFTGLPFLVLAILPTSVGWVAHLLDIDYRTVQVLFLAAFLILIVFELLTIVSLQDRRISTLAQIVGIMMQKHGMSDRPRIDEASADDFAKLSEPTTPNVPLSPEEARP
jgi:small-conductance mechanosensitive channel